MANSLKGNLGLKSSPLAPTSAKLTSQYIVLDHMNNHFNKISKAKAAIDNKPPKSLLTSQKMRDRRNRNRIMKSPQAYTSLDLQDEETQRRYQELLDEEPEDEEDRQVHSIMRSTLNIKPKGSNNATYGSQSDTTYMTAEQVKYSMGDTRQHHDMTNGYTMTATRPLSARSNRSAGSMSARAPLTHDTNRITYKGDVLQTRAHRFTDGGKPFTPRTNIRNAESKLKNSSCYNPPRNKSSPGKKQSMIEDGPRPKAAPRGGGRSSQGDIEPSYSNQNFQDGLETGQLSESMLMDMSLRSRDDHSNREGSDHQIPRLDISMDTDHINWLQEQASKAKVRTKSGAKVPISGEVIPEESASLNQSGGLSRSAKLENLKKPTNSESLWSLTSCTSCSSWVSQRIVEEEEEQKYLAFAQEVTDDVLARGISSERVIQRIFESHIERRRNELDETRMRNVIKDLRADLGLRENSSDRGSIRGVSNNNSNNLNRSRPGSSGKASEAGSVDALQQTAESEKSSLKDSSQGFTMTNGQSSSTLEPLHYQSTHSEGDLSATMESTSTMRFGQTREMFSTINSEATLEEREARLDEEEDDLSSTQALRQYQLSLTVKEAGGDEGAESVVTEPSESSHKLERPATGERRDADEEDTMKSDTSSLKGSQKGESLHRTRRRDRFRKAKAAEISSSRNSEPTSSDVVNGNRHQATSEEILSSEVSVNGHSNGNGGPGGQSVSSAHEDLTPQEGGDDTESVKSTSSSRPVARPRARARGKPAHHDVPSEERGMEVSSGQDSAREQLSEAKQDPSVSSAPSDSGVASGAHHHHQGHDDTIEDTSEAERHLGQGHVVNQGGSKEEMKEDPDEEYEDDYDADEDDGQGMSTNRTSDDDF